MFKLNWAAHVAVATMLCVGVTVSAQKKVKDQVMAGKSFQVEFNEQGAKKPAHMTGVISFKSERINAPFSSAQLKFPPALYTAEENSSDPFSASFTAESKNADKDVLKWEGTVNGDELEAKVTVVSAKGKLKREFIVTGKMKVKPVKAVPPPKPVEPEEVEAPSDEPEAGETEEEVPEDPEPEETSDPDRF